MFHFLRCGLPFYTYEKMAANQLYRIDILATDLEAILFAEIEVRLAAHVTFSRSSRLELAEIVQLLFDPSGTPENPLSDFGKIGTFGCLYHHSTIRMDSDFHRFPVHINHFKLYRFFRVHDRAA